MDCTRVRREKAQLICSQRACTIPTGGFEGRYRAGLVEGIVEDLDLEPISRPLYVAGGLKEAFHNIGFIEDWELDGDKRVNGL